MSKITKSEYEPFLQEIKEYIRKSQYEALKAVNKKLIALYWDIGKTIVERQKTAKWGKSVVERLAGDLQREFPGIKGFSTQNLWYMRQFYHEYSIDLNLQPMVGEISWAKHLVIMSKCKDSITREFYIKMTRKFGWTKNVLINHIENQTFKKTALNQVKIPKNVPEKYRNQVKLAVKDEYTFDFLNLGEDYSEIELENALILRVEKFLAEMGGDFTFVGRQFRLEVEGDEFFIDLLLYNRQVKSLVAIELKIGDFKPEFLGKIQFYLEVLDDTVRKEDENPSIGIIICKSKKRTIVEYALRTAVRTVGVAGYEIKKSVPKEMKGLLPSPQQLRKIVDYLDV